MTELEQMIAQVYAAFNRRNVEGALARMREDVSWPKASEGGRVEGKEAIRAYWGRQWEEFDPQVEPVAVLERGDGVVEVTVHQRVKSLAGEVLFDGEVLHLYTVQDGLIARMDLGAGDEAPSAAFGRR